MAITAALTEQHRQVQLAVRARALRDFTRIWPLWQPEDRASFGQLVQATQPLVTYYNGLSASAAVGYYEAARAVEHVAGAATPQFAAAPAEAMVRASLYATGETSVRAAIAAGQDPRSARETALVRTAGAVGRHVLDGGRGSIIQSVHADKQAVGWLRVTDGNPCAFCAMLASRGAVYKSEATADFQSHDHCGCTAMPLWEGTQLPSANRRFSELYDASQREAVENGELLPGENPSNDRLNAFRRYLAKHAVS